MVTHARTLRVMQSFGPPRPTSNPYIHLLDSALRAQPGIEHLRFNRRHALVGRYDILHFHWPETLLGGRTASRRFVRRLYATLLLARLSLSRVVIVRTLHNIDLPTGISRWDRFILKSIDRRTGYFILLNEDTPSRPGVPTALIPHGHYRDWFASVEQVPAESRSFGFVGLIRRYKGVESLLEAFGATKDTLPQWKLRVSGNPSPGVAEGIDPQVRKDARVALELGYLSEEDFAHAIMRSTGIVLPYRAMHNSGTALAALSLNRPVLIPRNTVNEALDAEVGPGWVFMFDDVLAATDLERFAADLEHGRPSMDPDLDGRGWQLTGDRLQQAYTEAVDLKGSRR